MAGMIPTNLLLEQYQPCSGRPPENQWRAADNHADRLEKIQETFGDSPNANKFHDVRVYSLSSPLSGSGSLFPLGNTTTPLSIARANV